MMIKKLLLAILLFATSVLGLFIFFLNFFQFFSRLSQILVKNGNNYFEKQNFIFCT